MKRLSHLTFLILLCCSFSNAQKAEITISFNEQFFDALLDAVFQHTSPPEFPLSQNRNNRREAETQSHLNGMRRNSFVQMGSKSSLPGLIQMPSSFSASPRLGGENPVCNESIRLLRENNGIRTSVRFRDGKIYAPLAFSGNYNPPFIGCVPFVGFAETNIELEFDQNNKRLIARAKVLNVSLNGTGGAGGRIIARMVQGSIDKKINPLEIIRMDKLSFLIPIQNSGGLKMKAVGMRHEITTGVLNVYIAYEFSKA